MKWTSCLAAVGVAAALVAVPVAAQAQDAQRPAREHADSARRMRGPQQRQLGRMMMNPAERLLTQRERLNLTADQVTRLEQMRDTYTAREKPFIEQMQRFRAERQKTAEGQPRPERGARPRTPAPPEVQAAMDSLRAIREAARKDATGVLTDEQRASAREMMQERMERRPQDMRRPQEMRRKRDSAGTRRG